MTTLGHTSFFLIVMLLATYFCIGHAFLSSARFMLYETPDCQLFFMLKSHLCWNRACKQELVLTEL